MSQRARVAHWNFGLSAISTAGIMSFKAEKHLLQKVIDKQKVKFSVRQRSESNGNLMSLC